MTGSNTRQADRKQLLSVLHRQAAQIVAWRPSRLFGRPLERFELQRARRALDDLAAAGAVELVRQHGRRLSHVKVRAAAGQESSR